MRLYRYHSAACKADLEAKYAKFPAKTRRDRIRDFKDCKCPIWCHDPEYLIEWHERSNPNPRCTTRFAGDDWADAELMVRKLDSKSKDSAAHGDPLDETIALYLRSRSQLSPRSLRAYVRILGAPTIDDATGKEIPATTGWLPFAHARNMFRWPDIDKVAGQFLLEFTTDGDVWGDCDPTKKMRLSKLKHFLKAAFRIGWTKISLVDKLPEFEAAEPDRTLPFNVRRLEDDWNEDESNRVLEFAGTVNGKSEGFGKVPATFRLLCELMNETGMAVSDTISFDPRLCVWSNPMWKYEYLRKKQKHTKKKPLKSTIYLTPRLKEAIDGCEWMSKELPFAYCGPIYRYPKLPKKGEADLTEKLALEVYKRLKKVIGPKAGVPDCRPHRFRDTFAIRLLMHDEPIDRVSKALNHTKTTITEKYYTSWIKPREKKLENDLFAVMTKLRSS